MRIRYLVMMIGPTTVRIGSRSVTSTQDTQLKLHCQTVNMQCSEWNNSKHSHVVRHVVHQNRYVSVELYVCFKSCSEVSPILGRPTERGFCNFFLNSGAYSRPQSTQYMQCNTCQIVLNVRTSFISSINLCFPGRTIIGIFQETESSGYCSAN